MASSNLIHDDVFVPVVDGPIVPADAYHLRLDLADRGLTLTRLSETTLKVTPPEHLAPADQAAIARWKWHLLMLVDYEGRTNFDALVRAACNRRRPA